MININDGLIYEPADEGVCICASNFLFYCTKHKEAPPKEKEKKYKIKKMRWIYGNTSSLLGVCFVFFVRPRALSASSRLFWCCWPCRPFFPTPQIEEKRVVETFSFFFANVAWNSLNFRFLIRPSLWMISARFTRLQERIHSLSPYLIYFLFFFRLSFDKTKKRKK